LGKVNLSPLAKKKRSGPSRERIIITEKSKTHNELTNSTGTVPLSELRRATDLGLTLPSQLSTATTTTSNNNNNNENVSLHSTSNALLSPRLVKNNSQQALLDTIASSSSSSSSSLISTEQSDTLLRTQTLPQLITPSTEHMTRPNPTTIGHRRVRSFDIKNASFSFISESFQIDQTTQLKRTLAQQRQVSIFYSCFCSYSYSYSHF
jgi:hypothetical protein